jgi:hypothetical protein
LTALVGHLTMEDGAREAACDIRSAKRTAML